MNKLKINIERLIDAVIDEQTAHEQYILRFKKLYHNSLDRLQDKGILFELLYHYDWQKCVVLTLIDIFQMDEEQQERLYIAARAAERWRKRTKYKRLLPDTMQQRIERFIFGD